MRISSIYRYELLVKGNKVILVLCHSTYSILYTEEEGIHVLYRYSIRKIEVKIRNHIRLPI